MKNRQGEECDKSQISEARREAEEIGVQWKPKIKNYAIHFIQSERNSNVREKRSYEGRVNRIERR